MQIVEHFFQKEFLKFKNNITFADLKKSPDGGNGRRAWLRAMSPLGGASSILVLGTESGIKALENNFPGLFCFMATKLGT